MSPVCSPRYLETYCVLHKSIVLHVKHSNIYLSNPTIYFYLVLVLFSFEPKNWMSFEDMKFIFFFLHEKGTFVLIRKVNTPWLVHLCLL